jgi:Rrf2 family iron-sulfur cluster assembly transcriptional regulator
MLDLALHEDQGPITLADISLRQGVSISYLEQLFAKLRRSKLVESVRGPGGGYRLSGGPAAISVAQIVEAVNDSMDATRCLGKGDCQHGEVCLTHHLWSDLSARLRQFLNGITLADLVSRDDIQRVKTRQDGCSVSARQAVNELERII